MNKHVYKVWNTKIRQYVNSQQGRSVWATLANAIVVKRYQDFLYKLPKDQLEIHEFELKDFKVIK